MLKHIKIMLNSYTYRMLLTTHKGLVKYSAATKNNILHMMFLRIIVDLQSKRLRRTMNQKQMMIDPK